MPILVGDAFHNFADGVVIAGAFLVDVQLGIVATLAVMAHEIPHEVGDFMILLNAGFTKKRAFVFNLISGLSAVLGGVIGYFVLEAMQSLLPYALAIAAASFIYIALSDLLPEMMRRSSLAKSLPEVGWCWSASSSRRWRPAPSARIENAAQRRERGASWLAGTAPRLLRFRAGADRSRRIGDPFAPRARIERRARQSRDFHCQHVVAGGHAGAALVRHLIGGAATQQGVELGAQFRRRLEALVRA